MMPRLISTVLSSLLLSSALAQDAATEQCEQLCLEENRMCVVADDGGFECGECLEGFVEFGKLVGNPTCVEIDTLKWEQFLKEYQPVYKTELSPEERLEILIEIARFISEHNANQTSSFTLGLTPYSVDSDLEYVQRSGYFNAEDATAEMETYEAPTIAAADLQGRVDWVELGGVTSVKDQGRCGSCWAVSMCGAIEGAAFANNGYFQSLSFQQFVSCNDRNLGCDGGNVAIAALYASFENGISRLNEYEYTDYFGTTTQECYLSPTATPKAVEVTKPQIVAGMSTSLTYEERSEIFKQVLDQQPIAMVIKSACKTLSNYRSGVITDDGDCACSRPDCLDHAVLMVGYDDTAEIPYFKIKNSWGTGWGEDGYVRIAQTSKGTYGLFGMLAEGTIVQAQNVTAQVVDNEQDTPFPIWAIVLIVALSLCLCLCVCTWFKKRGAKEAAGE